MNAAQQLHALRAVVQDLAKQQHHSSVFEAAVLQRTAQDITSLVLEGWSTEAPHTILSASAIKQLRSIRRRLLTALALAAIQYSHAVFLVSWRSPHDPRRAIDILEELREEMQEWRRRRKRDDTVHDAWSTRTVSLLDDLSELCSGVLEAPTGEPVGTVTPHTSPSTELVHTMTLGSCMWLTLFVCTVLGTREPSSATAHRTFARVVANERALQTLGLDVDASTMKEVQTVHEVATRLGWGAAMQHNQPPHHRASSRTVRRVWRTVMNRTKRAVRVLARTPTLLFLMRTVVGPLVATMVSSLQADAFVTTALHVVQWLLRHSDVMHLVGTLVQEVTR